ncbi:DUF4760 domain-containing protein [Roseibium algae]|uniref:DUF4760 domain-containing protein n=1 Tax=Roseibium algae TaxID=3123038 RepID=A0ABU8TNZ8_9HYPH
MKCSEEIIKEATQTVIVCVAYSFNWPYLASLCLVLLSIGVATWGVKTARASARQRATLDLIEKVESAPHYQQLNKAFSYRRRTGTLTHLIAPQETTNQEERQKITSFLNHYELETRKNLLFCFSLSDLTDESSRFGPVQAGPCRVWVVLPPFSRIHSMALFRSWKIRRSKL